MTSEQISATEYQPWVGRSSSYCPQWEPEISQTLPLPPRWYSGYSSKQCLPLDLTFKPGPWRWISKGDKKNRSTTSFRGEVKSSVPRRKILWYIKECHEYDKDISYEKFSSHLSPSFSCFATRSSASNCHTALMDESGMIINQKETNNRSEMVTGQGSPFAPTP